MFFLSIACTHAKRRPHFENTLLGQASPFEGLEKRSRLRSVLLNWAAEFNAGCSWLLDDALRTLRGWRVAPDWRESLKWSPLHGRSDPAAIGEGFEFRCEGWETQLLSWSDYRASVRRRFEKTLSDYEKKTRELAESLGLVRTRRKYSPDNFDWFVLYQFAGMSSTKIADRQTRTGKTVDESTVLKGIKAAAKLIRWNHLREPKQTRSRKIR